MVQAITGFRPYVSTIPSITQQQRVNQIKLERNQVTDDLRNGKISDLQAMSEKTALDSKLSDAKTSSKADHYVSEPIMVPKGDPKGNRVDSEKFIKETPANIQAIDRQFKGKELSEKEKQTLVENQMQQIAISNAVFHGLAPAI